MKSLVIAITGIIAAIILVPTPTNATGSSNIQLEILPIDCIFEIINDGNNTIKYITPEKCGKAIEQTPGPPSNNGNGRQGTNNSSGLDLSTLLYPVASGAITSSIANDLDNQEAPSITSVCGAHSDEYVSATRQELKMSLGYSVCFGVQSQDIFEGHTLTIKEIGSNYVIITVASKPTDLYLGLGQTRLHDVTGDGEDDIEVSLNAIADGVANITFRALTEPAGSTSTDKRSEGSGQPRAWQYVVLAGIAATGLLILWARQRRKI